MEIVNEKVERYMASLLESRGQEVLEQMETEGRERDFPIVGRTVGVTLEILARAVGARRVLEMGSGFGFSAYWFARAVGPGGEIHLTDGDPENERKALDNLGRAGLADRCTFHVGNALDIIDELPGEFDVIFCDIDKSGYPDAWKKARERIRIGGLYLCDNVLWSGRVAEDVGTDDRRPEWTAAVKEHNQAIAEDDRYLSVIVPTRDGVMVALRVS
ncbi:MAG TPA: O-methyltransferase [Actinomycetota bacterium]|jgi:predicted O-methyltransferase YrrM|nr:O-methyltransferase [Actinomycetota bacterium]